MANRISSGLAIFDPDHTELIRELDATFTGWALEAGAEQISVPPVYPVEDLEKFDVYDNFPHLALVAGPLADPERSRPEGHRLPSDRLAGAHLGLPTAACFGAYLYFEDRRIPSSTLVTLVNRCFRNEEYFDGLRRLLGFQMREVVPLGDSEHVSRILAAFTGRIAAFLDALDLEARSAAATDPFFDREGGRAVMQRLQEVKREFIVDDLAIASVNVHRNFFGERCGITTGDGANAFTGCVAFGLERWASVLLTRYGNAEKAAEAVRSASPGPE
ncbi:class-II aminoacyl-tRNA synthetase family protein [Nocardiopsis potens]|uniref:hypothetical protein n=1 Tax=Nocardiopsis potens TaxID=1246458 RepID=UPI000347601D|nr:hypothetical protein [Nocardiopsis potens]